MDRDASPAPEGWLTGDQIGCVPAAQDRAEKLDVLVQRLLTPGRGFSLDGFCLTREELLGLFALFNTYEHAARLWWIPERAALEAYLTLRCPKLKGGDLHYEHKCLRITCRGTYLDNDGDLVPIAAMCKRCEDLYKADALPRGAFPAFEEVGLGRVTCPVWMAHWEADFARMLRAEDRRTREATEAATEAATQKREDWLASLGCCPITRNDITDAVRTSCCKNVFEGAALRMWIRRGRGCPLCRARAFSLVELTEPE